MPVFDLRNIKVAEYKVTGNTPGYEASQPAGDAMNVNLELRHAEGRLYAESSLAEYMKKATGGSMSIGVKYLPDPVQKLLFGYTDKTRTVGEATVSSLVMNKRAVAKYAGVSFYAPDMIDGVEKYTCVQVKRALFGPPSMSYQTMGENIVFSTPTTSGEFLPDAAGDLIETAICDDEATAIAWCDAVFGD